MTPAVLIALILAGGSPALPPALRDVSFGPTLIRPSQISTAAKGNLMCGLSGGTYSELAASGGTNGNVLALDSTQTCGVKWTSAGSGTVTGSGTSTRIAFWSSASALSSNANLFWDNTNSRLGVNTTSPSAPVHVLGTALDADGLMTQGMFGGTKRVLVGYDSTNDYGFLAAVDTGVAWKPLDLQPTSGGVGIRNTAPLKLLHVGAGTDAATQSYDGILVDLNAAAQIAVRDATDDSEIGMFAHPSGGFFGTWTNHPLQFRTNNTNAMFISATQKVGIGTTTANSVLTVASGNASAVVAYNGTQPASFSTYGTAIGAFDDGSGSNDFASVLAGQSLQDFGGMRWNYNATTTSATLDVGTFNAQTLRFVTNGAVAWGVNTAKDLLNSSGHIVYSVGTPTAGTVTGGTSPSVSITGVDSAFTADIVTSTSASTSAAFTFGHTFSNAPSCTVSTLPVSGGGALTGVDIRIDAYSTTSITVAYSNTKAITHEIQFSVHCLGY